MNGYRDEHLPPNLPVCDPFQRLFPREWKESYFRRNYDDSIGGYLCPDCERKFSGTSGLAQLEGDHIIPFSKGGSTEWRNFILRCKPCNIAKSDSLPPEKSRKL